MDKFYKTFIKVRRQQLHLFFLELPVYTKSQLSDRGTTGQMMSRLFYQFAVLFKLVL